MASTSDLGVLHASFLAKLQTFRGWERRYYVVTRRSFHRFIKTPTDDLFGTLRETVPRT